MKKNVLILYLFIVVISAYSLENEIKENDVFAFVYTWFSQFDRQVPCHEFLQYLPDSEFHISFPGTSIRNKPDFKLWYDGILQSIKSNTHKIVSIKILEKEQNFFVLTVLVRWKATTYTGENYDNTYQQSWKLRIINRNIFIESYIVKQVGLMEVYSSYRQWTGIAVSPQGRIFVNYPRWSKDVPVSVAEILRDGSIRPYPNEQKNLWTEESGSLNDFVCIQSVVSDEEGYLWILDSGNPQFQGVKKGAVKLIKVDISKDQIVHTYFLDEHIAPLHSYLNDVRFDIQKGFAYLSDSGLGAIVVLDLKTNKARRVLENHFSTKSENIVLKIGGKEWRMPDGTALQIHCDGIALSHDKNYLYYQALTGRSLYRIRTCFLQDENISAANLEKKVEFVAKTGAADGLEFDANGNLYISSLERNAICLFTPENILKIAIEDERIAWPDSFAISKDGIVYFTTSQIHLGNNISMPYRIFKIVPCE